jgi:pyroglutamyl-peptidase
MKWLVSCFEPFDNATSNSSEILWRRLQKFSWGESVRFAGPLPVTFAGSWPGLRREIEDVDGVLALGQAEGRKKISLECLALNWVDARIADNAGEQPRLKKVGEGPDVLWSQIPWAQLGENELFERSYTAGTFVCNSLMYDVVKWAQENRKLGGFVHIPLLESQSEVQFEKMAKMNDHKAVEGLEAILRFLAGLKV